MKTTPDGLTHLINMLVDVVNLQRKAQGTPGACCEVELRLDEEESRVSVHVYTEVYLSAQPPTTLSADNNRGSGLKLTPVLSAAVRQSFLDIGCGEGASAPERCDPC
jgi:hypothetical protein